MDATKFSGENDEAVNQREIYSVFDQSYKPDQKKFRIKIEETMLEKADEKEQYKPKPQEEPNRKDISSMLKLLGNLEPQQSVAKKEQIDLKEKNAFKVKDNNSIISHKS